MGRVWLGGGIAWSTVTVIIWKAERKEDGKFYLGFSISGIISLMGFRGFIDAQTF